MDVESSLSASPAPLNPQQNNKLSAEPAKKPKTQHHKCRNICLSITAAVIVIVIIIVILVFTVFKAKQPVTTITSITLDDLDYALDLPRLRVDLNVTLKVSLTIKNRNKVGFKFRNSEVFIYFKSEVVGEVQFAGDKMSPNELMPMNVTLTLMADRLLTHPGLLGEVMGGTLPLSTSTKISGKVIIINIIKIHVDAESSCDFVVFLSNSTVSDSDCKTKTKL